MENVGKAERIKHVTIADEGVEYTEIFWVIEKYAEMDLNHQVKALSLVADNYTPFGNLPMDETRDIVERIFAENDYQIGFGGRPSPDALDAVVAVAKWGEQQEWASRVLKKVLDSLLNRPRARVGQDPGQGQAPARLDGFAADAMGSVLKALHEVERSTTRT